MSEKSATIFAKGVATFYCRKYLRGIEYNQSPMAAEGERITLVLTCKTEDIPDSLRPFANDVAVSKSRTTDDGTPLTSFSFKVGKFCKFYDMEYFENNGVDSPITKPTNEYLEGRRYDVELAFNYMPKNPNDHLAPSGFWLNGCRMKEHVSDFNPFGAQTAAPQTAAPASQMQAEVEPQEKDLPF